MFVVENMVAGWDIDAKVGAVADYQIWTIVYVKFPIWLCRSPETPLSIHDDCAEANALNGVFNLPKFSSW
jgi:hypothetical protein